MKGSAAAPCLSIACMTDLYLGQVYQSFPCSSSLGKVVVISIDLVPGPGLFLMWMTITMEGASWSNFQKLSAIAARAPLTSLLHPPNTLLIDCLQCKALCKVHASRCKLVTH